ncbi:MAG: ArsR/SmtB family transcription factor [Acidimicrobiia bacterium]
MPRPVYQLKAEFFKTLGHPARIRILEVLREGDQSVGELIPQVGIEATHLSHQLAVLRRANVIRSRKVGATVIYSVFDPRIFQLLEVAKQILTGSLLATQELLVDLESLSFQQDVPEERR